MPDLFTSPLPTPLRQRSGWYAWRTKLKARHEGYDFACPVGTEVYAMASGVVRLARTDSPSAGDWIVLVHDGDATGFSSRYLHCSRLTVKTGDRVRRGQVIALSGNKGWSTGPHLHLDIQAGIALVQRLRPLGLLEVGRAAPGAGGRRNVPVEQLVREVFTYRHLLLGEQWPAFLG